MRMQIDNQQYQDFIALWKYILVIKDIPAYREEILHLIIAFLALLYEVDFSLIQTHEAFDIEHAG